MKIKKTFISAIMILFASAVFAEPQKKTDYQDYLTYYYEKEIPYGWKSWLQRSKTIEDYFEKSKMVKIPGRDYEMLQTEVTQELYSAVMGENPSYNKGENNPVENVSWYDAISFCNVLSTFYGLTPAYSVDGETVDYDRLANGYRLPTIKEWQYAAKGANRYGLYDMSGNVSEWCFNVNGGNAGRRCYCGGSYDIGGNYSCTEVRRDWWQRELMRSNLGFRLVRNCK